MCGFIVVTNTEQISEFKLLKNLERRGPDTSGSMYFDQVRVQMGHCRLAIIGGQDCIQPYFSQQHSLSIVFNGEIYNYKEIKGHLIELGYSFETDGDTEVVLLGFIEFGIRILDKLRGMFSFVIVNSKSGEIFAVRDQFGIKPLYYSIQRDKVVLASSISAVKDHICSNELNFDLVGDFLLDGYVSEPSTIYKDINSLEAGNLLHINEKDVKISQYWNLYENTLDLRNNLLDIDQGEAENLVREYFVKAVKRNLVGDVGIGVLFSGGLDSACIVGASEELNHPLNGLFTLDFETAWSKYSERERVSRNLNFFKTQRSFRHILSTNDLNQIYCDYWQSLDNPTIDGGNTFAITKFMRERNCKVALTGLGSDELFGGYKHFENIIQNSNIWGRINAPCIADRLVNSSIYKFVGYSNVMRLFHMFSSPKESISLVRRALLISEIKELLIELDLDSRIRVKSILERKRCRIDQLMKVELGIFDQISYIEMSTYVRNCLLPDADFASMYNGIELRPPFLDLDLASLVFALPERVKFNEGNPKSLLKKSLKGFYPGEIEYEKKTGFDMPYREFMKLIGDESPYSLQAYIVKNLLKNEM